MSFLPIAEVTHFSQVWVLSTIWGDISDYRWMEGEVVALRCCCMAPRSRSSSELLKYSILSPRLRAGGSLLWILFSTAHSPRPVCHSFMNQCNEVVNQSWHAGIKLGLLDLLGYESACISSSILSGGINELTIVFRRPFKIVPKPDGRPAVEVMNGDKKQQFVSIPRFRVDHMDGY